MSMFPAEPSYFIPAQLDRLLAFCYEEGASDITIQSGEQVIADIEGRLERITARSLTQQEVSDLINHIYGPNATALLFSGTDIDTNYRVRLSDDLQYRYRVNITACIFDGYQGIQVTLRTISSSPPPIEAMNLQDDLYKALRIPQGIVVVSGATGSGKSTLLASIVADFAGQADSHLKILTYESPIEYVYDDVVKPACIVSQTEIPRYLPSFAAGVRNALRRKPGLILVGEARDQETIEAVIDAALTGHPVYTTVHSNGVADTLRRMITIFPHAERDARLFDLLETTKVIVWQALVSCTDGKRTPLREYLLITPEVRDALIATPVDQVVSQAREMLIKHGRPIEVDAQEKFDAGLIDERVLRRFIPKQGGTDGR
jgi:defect in organelle trafficking protein DotB